MIEKNYGSIEFPLVQRCWKKYNTIEYWQVCTTSLPVIAPWKFDIVNKGQLTAEH